MPTHTQSQPQIHSCVRCYFRVCNLRRISSPRTADNGVSAVDRFKIDRRRRVALRPLMWWAHTFASIPTTLLMNVPFSEPNKDNSPRHSLTLSHIPLIKCTERRTSDQVRATCVHNQISLYDSIHVRMDARGCCTGIVCFCRDAPTMHTGGNSCGKSSSTHTHIVYGNA